MEQEKVLTVPKPLTQHFEDNLNYSKRSNSKSREHLRTFARDLAAETRLKGCELQHQIQKQVSTPNPKPSHTRFDSDERLDTSSYTARAYPANKNTKTFTTDISSLKSAYMTPTSSRSRSNSRSRRLSEHRQPLNHYNDDNIAEKWQHDKQNVSSFPHLPGAQYCIDAG